MVVRALSLIWLIFVAVAAAAPPGDGTAAEPARVAESAKKPDKKDPPAGVNLDSQAHLRRLNHEDYRERKAAQKSLLEWGKRDLTKGIETLYGVYQTTDDPEVRLRSREVLKRLVIIKQPFEGAGYLGIKMENAQVKDADGELQPAVRVTEVREGTAAEVAKLQVDDLVTGVDHLVFDGLALPITSFGDYIRSKKPGDEITLHVRRGAESLTMKPSLRRRSPLLDRFTQWGTTQFDLPKQSDLDEADFHDWLRTRAAAERDAARGQKRPAPAP